VSVGAGTCLPSRCLETALHAAILTNKFKRLSHPLTVVFLSPQASRRADLLSDDPATADRFRVRSSREDFSHLITGPDEIETCRIQEITFSFGLQKALVHLVLSVGIQVTVLYPE
jgi:hypothetical protein